MIKTHVVRQGEYLTKIAYELKLPEDDILLLAQNEELFTLRDPNVLHAGDVVSYEPFVPEKGSFAPTQPNHYKTPVPKVTLELTFTRFGKPLANESYKLTGVGQTVEGTTDGSAKASLSVPVNVSEVRVAMRDGALVFGLKVGFLEPVEEDPGGVQRLATLGYLYLPHDATEELRERRIERAYLEFQRDEGLPQSGFLDEETMNALFAACGY